MEFPRLVYRSPSDHALAEDDNQFVKHLLDGWFASVPEAADGHHSEETEQLMIECDDLNEDDAPTREEMAAKAKELGINFDGRISNQKLFNLIAAEIEKSKS